MYRLYDISIATKIVKNIVCRSGEHGHAKPLKRAHTLFLAEKKKIIRSTNLKSNI